VAGQSVTRAACGVAVATARVAGRAGGHARPALRLGRARLSEWSVLVPRPDLRDRSARAGTADRTDPALAHGRGTPGRRGMAPFGGRPQAALRFGDLVRRRRGPRARRGHLGPAHRGAVRTV